MTQSKKGCEYLPQGRAGGGKTYTPSESARGEGALLAARPLSQKTKGRGPSVEGDLGMGRAGSTIQIIDSSSPLLVLGARLQPHVRAFSSAQHVSSEELLGFQEPCKALECLPGRNLNIKRFKGGWKIQSSNCRKQTCLLSPIFMTFIVTTGVTKNPGESQHLPSRPCLLRKSTLPHYLDFYKLGKEEK